MHNKTQTHKYIVYFLIILTSSVVRCQNIEEQHVSVSESPSVDLSETSYRAKAVSAVASIVFMPQVVQSVNHKMKHKQKSSTSNVSGGTISWFKTKSNSSGNPISLAPRTDGVKKRHALTQASKGNIIPENGQLSQRKHQSDKFHPLYHYTNIYQASFSLSKSQASHNHEQTTSLFNTPQDAKVFQIQPGRLPQMRHQKEQRTSLASRSREPHVALIPHRQQDSEQQQQVSEQQKQDSVQHQQDSEQQQQDSVQQQQDSEEQQQDSIQQQQHTTPAQKKLITPIQQKLITPEHQQLITPVYQQLEIPEQHLIAPVQQKQITTVQQKLIIPVQHQLITPIRKRKLFISNLSGGLLSAFGPTSLEAGKQSTIF